MFFKKKEAPATNPNQAFYNEVVKTATDLCINEKKTLEKAVEKAFKKEEKNSAFKKEFKKTGITPVLDKALSLKLQARVQQSIVNRFVNHSNFYKEVLTHFAEGTNGDMNHKNAKKVLKKSFDRSIFSNRKECKRYGVTPVLDQATMAMLQPRLAEACKKYKIEVKREVDESLRIRRENEMRHYYEMEQINRNRK